MELADFEKMEQIRARVDEVVTDSDTAGALKPWYRQFCKRPCFHDEYLQTFNRPNVRLVDTDGRGVDRITPRGAIVGETEYPLDCLIYATGFEVGTDYTRRAGYDVIGTRGVKLSDYWADGMKSLFGMHVHGFPNMFVIGHTQGAFTANYPHLLDEATAHMCHILRYALDHDVLEIEAGGRGRGEMGDDPQRDGVQHPRLPGAVHARVLQQRGQAQRRRWLDRQLLRQGAYGVLPAHVRMALSRRFRRPGDPSLTRQPSLLEGPPGEGRLGVAPVTHWD